MRSVAHQVRGEQYQKNSALLIYRVSFWKEQSHASQESSENSSKGTDLSETEIDGV